MTPRALVALGWKELRALFPLWLACILTIAAHGLLRGSFLPMLATFAYIFGSVALGAQSIGHEYGYGTLGILLSQPADRRRIFVVKLVVLAAFLATLWFAASLTLFDSTGFRSHDLSDAPVHLPPLVGLGGLFVAPALTMLTRGWNVAGSVFTIGLAGSLWVALTLVAIARFGTANTGLVDRFIETVFWPAMYGTCAVAAVASWWMFGRLQVIDGRGAEIHLTLWPSRSSPARRATRRPGVLGQLIAKELYLHQMPFVLAGVYVLVAAASTMWPRNPDMRIDPMIPITVLYAVTIISLIGTFASAEERQLGTHDWQLLTPLAAWKQWAVKVSVALTLAFALGLGIPAAASALAPAIAPFSPRPESIPIAILALTTFSLYVSSLSTSGIRALIVTFPALYGLGYVSQQLAFWVMNGLYQWGFRPLYGRRFPYWVEPGAIAAIVCTALIVLAYRNHCSGERAWGRVALQLASLVAIFVVVVVTSELLRL